jgi:hypothetical protein
MEGLGAIVLPRQVVSYSVNAFHVLGKANLAMVLGCEDVTAQEWGVPVAND